MSMSQPRRSARLALQRERAESRPAEPVSIDSLVSDGTTQPRAQFVASAVPATWCTSHVVIMPLLQGAFAMAFACPMQPCVECVRGGELDDEVNIFSCSSSSRVESS